MSTRVVSKTINLEAAQEQIVEKYITRISDRGISIHPENTTVNKKNVLIDGEGISILDDNSVLASFKANGSQIGLDGESRLLLDYHSMQLIDKEDTSYFYISDLRDRNGEATITEVFTGDGNTTSFTVQFLVSTEVSAVDSSDETNTASKRNSVYTFLRAPADGATVTIVYKTMSDIAKAFTIGTRNPLYNVGAFSIVEGVNNIASNYGSYAEGFHTESTGMASHAEGNGTTASGAASHAEGSITDAVGRYSHAEGRGSYAKGDYSHAEGQVTYARGLGAHAEGVESEANKYASHAEGNNTIADGDNSHAQNEYTIAGKNGQTAVGTYNKRDSSATTTHPSNTAEYGKYSVIIGNGTADDARSNAFTVDWQGRVEAGDYSGNFKSIFDIFYPIGSYYETSLPGTIPSGSQTPTAADIANLGTTWFDPNYAWGGTWVLEAEGKTHISAGSTYNAGTEYGANTKSYTPAGTNAAVTLTAAQSGVPAHKHTTASHGHNNTFSIANGGGSHSHEPSNVSRSFLVAETSGISINRTNIKNGTGTQYDNCLRVGSTSGYVNSTESVSISHSHTLNGGVSGSGQLTSDNNTTADATKSHNHTFTGTQASINVMQASIAVYRWHRTS